MIGVALLVITTRYFSPQSHASTAPACPRRPAETAAQFLTAALARL